MKQGKKRRNWSSAMYVKVRTQLLEWISQKTQVTIGFSSGMFAGHLTGQLSEAAEPDPKGFKVLSGNDLIIFCPLVCETLTIENTAAHVVVTMKQGDSGAQISPFVNLREGLKTLPVDDSHVN
jgi:hypothetical protein